MDDYHRGEYVSENMTLDYYIQQKEGLSLQKEENQPKQTTLRTDWVWMNWLREDNDEGYENL
jgi:hypothetical protein